MIKEKLKSIYDFVGNFLMVIAVFALLFLAASKIVPHFDYYLVVVQSGSMRPAITEGSVLLIKQKDIYKLNDVITFNRSGNRITHRVVALEKEGDEILFKTKGDGNNSKDLFFVSRRDILGKAIFNMPYVGYLIVALRHKVGFIVLTIVPAIWIISIEIKKIRKHLEEKRKTDEGS